MCINRKSSTDVDRLNLLLGHDEEQHFSSVFQSAPSIVPSANTNLGLWMKLKFLSVFHWTENNAKHRHNDILLDRLFSRKSLPASFCISHHVIPPSACCFYFSVLCFYSEQKKGSGISEAKIEILKKTFEILEKNKTGMPGFESQRMKSSRENHTDIGIRKIKLKIDRFEPQSSLNSGRIVCHHQNNTIKTNEQTNRK